ncbi:NAD(P)H-binding protein [Pseudolysinimonas sp.]|uniref:NAD(P)H-binding protein n=1 Tax=Pseudolysinimonas sp. TaxID=2680009 RepID=UPI003F7E800D
MSRIVILGGHGKVALLLAPLLVARGDTVAGVIRDPAQGGEVRASGADPVVADIEGLDVAGIAELLHGADAVVWSAGAGGGSAERTYAVDRDAAIRAMEAADRAGVRRFVMVSYSGSRPDHGVPEDDGFFAYAEAKAAADVRLRASGLDWSIAAPSRLTLESGTGRIAVIPDDRVDEPSQVPREDVAAVVAAMLAQPESIGRTLRFSGGDAPIAEALRIPR